MSQRTGSPSVVRNPVISPTGHRQQAVDACNHVFTSGFNEESEKICAQNSTQRMHVIETHVFGDAS